MDIYTITLLSLRKGGLSSALSEAGVIHGLPSLEGDLIRMVLHTIKSFVLKIVVLTGIMAILSVAGYTNNLPLSIKGEMKTWYPVTLAFSGPDTSEQDNVNPFRDYRLTVTFSLGDKVYKVPGYYAADGEAGNSGADKGNKWRVHFTPDQAGQWKYSVSFLKGHDVALDAEAKYGRPTAFDGASGSLAILECDKSSRDVRSKGMLKYNGGHYLQYAGSGEYYLKGGADSPENFLAYFEFDQTYRYEKNTALQNGEAKTDDSIHLYEAHAKDWKLGDPTWGDRKGKNIIGALNYLASTGMNSVYFLTMNVGGDGKDVWPWVSPTDRFHYDCSKLDQWNVVFSRMDELGLAMHVVTQETENDQLLDDGELGRERKLYYRELIARFSHHLGVVWNLGEENTNTNKQRKAFADYINAVDPYKHPIVVHTFPGEYEKVYQPLVGFKSLQGASLQIADMKLTHEETIKWWDKSDQTAQKWLVSLDEIGPSCTGVKPDSVDASHDDPRHFALWGNLMAGGAGCEWYFGYAYPDNDLKCEDWRSREAIWKQTKIALDFFQNNLPYWEMKHADELVCASGAYCFAKPGEAYAIYLPNGSTTCLDLAEGDYKIFWCNPRVSAELLYGSKAKISGPGKMSVGQPPSEPTKDWVVLVKKIVKPAAVQKQLTPQSVEGLQPGEAQPAAEIKGTTGTKPSAAIPSAEPKPALSAPSAKAVKESAAKPAALPKSATEAKPAKAEKEIAPAKPAGQPKSVSEPQPAKTVQEATPVIPVVLPTSDSVAKPAAVPQSTTAAQPADSPKSATPEQSAAIPQSATASVPAGAPQSATK